MWGVIVRDGLLPINSIYLGLCLEGFLFGFYSGIFVLYLRRHACKRNNEKQNILLYALCGLYVSSAALIAIDIALILAFLLLDFWTLSPQPRSLPAPANLKSQFLLVGDVLVAQPIVFAICDFVAQLILIHRCWIVWGHNIRVVIIPSMFACVFFALWIVGTSGAALAFTSAGPNALGLTSLAVSMTVNAIVTGLILFKIFKVFHGVKRHCITTSGGNGGRKLRSIIFIIIESGVALFSIQFTRLILLTLKPSTLQLSAVNALYQIIVHIHSMLNGITPTLILVRVSLGLSFHDESSLKETVGNLRFAAENPNPISITTSISQDGSSLIGHDESIGETINISQETREDRR